MPSEGRGILSPVRLPVPPLQRVGTRVAVTPSITIASAPSVMMRSLASTFRSMMRLPSLFAKARSRTHPHSLRSRQLLPSSTLPSSKSKSPFSKLVLEDALMPLTSFSLWPRRRYTPG